MHDASTSSRLSKYSHSVRITAKQVNVCLDPLKGQSLIVQTKIRSAICLECRSTEPAKSAESVVHGNIDDAVSVVILTASQ